MSHMMGTARAPALSTSLTYEAAMYECPLGAGSPSCVQGRRGWRGGWTAVGRGSTSSSSSSSSSTLAGWLAGWLAGEPRRGERGLGVGFASCAAERRERSRQGIGGGQQS